MKKIIALSALLALGALGMACGPEPAANNAQKANAANTVNSLQTAANQVQNAANALANAAANTVNAASNAVKPANANSNANANANANANKPK